MNEEEKSMRYIPIKVDDPVPILFFEPLEFVMLVSIFGISVAMGFMLIGAILSILLIFALRKLKRGAKKGATQHAIWSAGLRIDRGMSRFPQAWDNDLIE